MFFPLTVNDVLVNMKLTSFFSTCTRLGLVNYFSKCKKLLVLLTLVVIVITFTVFRLVMYEPGGQEEPPYQYVPESPLSEMQRGAGALEQSMLLLADGLASGALVAQFEQLYRKKPGMSCNESKKTENINKNRYRDISPCKC